MLVTAGVALAACATGDRPVTQASFTCGETRVATAFTREDLVIEFEGRRAELTQAISASGARFVGQAGPDRVIFWDRGSTALFTVGEKAYPECTRDDPDLTRSPKRDRGG